MNTSMACAAELAQREVLLLHVVQALPEHQLRFEPRHLLELSPL